MELAGNIIGVIAVIESLLIYAVQKRSHILTLKLVSNVLWGTNYLLLGLYTGALLNLIAIVRECIFLCRTRYKWADNIAWAILFMAIMFSSSFVTWAGWISLLPAIGSVFNVVSIYSKKPLFIRIFLFPAEGLWLIYALLSFNVTAAINEIMLILSAVIGMIWQYALYRKAKKMSKVETNKAEEKIELTE